MIAARLRRVNPPKRLAGEIAARLRTGTPGLRRVKLQIGMANGIAGPGGKMGMLAAEMGNAYLVPETPELKSDYALPMPLGHHKGQR